MVGTDRRKGVDRRAAPARGDVAEAVLDEATIAAIEAEHSTGLSSAQIVEAFAARGARLSEATFRKWVQLGLLPRSRRIGRKGKHQGSLGIYPPSTVRRIAAIKRLMAESLTIEDIARSLRFRDEIEALERGLGELCKGIEEKLQQGAGLDEAERKKGERELAEVRKQAGELVRRIGSLERRVVVPLERDARARAFGSGAAGGAGDLL